MKDQDTIVGNVSSCGCNREWLVLNVCCPTGANYDFCASCREDKSHEHLMWEETGENFGE